MKYGFISDIHGNYDGLRIAMCHLKKLGCEIVCLGDIVSENSEHNEQCVQLLKKLNIQTVRGQHDDTCVQCNSPPVSPQARSYLQSMPEMMTNGNILCVHDNPLERARNGQGMWKSGSYIWSQTEAAVVFEDFFTKQCEVRYLFIGHTHTSKVFSPDREIQIVYNQPITLAADQAYIINPGHIGGAQRTVKESCSYLLFDQERHQVVFFRVEKEGRAFAKLSVAEGGKKISVAVQKILFTPYFQEANHKAAHEPEPELKTGTSLMFQVTEKLSVCGYSGIPSQGQFKGYGFKAHLQCTSGFEKWLDTEVEVKCCPFEDCAPVPAHIFSTAYDWLGSHWDRGHRILISCAAGESRSVSMAIGLLTLKAGLSFFDACGKVFSAIPYAYPHPKTLLSVADYCGVALNLDQLKMIYAKITIPPPFPWQESEFIQALSQHEGGR